MQADGGQRGCRQTLSTPLGWAGFRGILGSRGTQRTAGLTIGKAGPVPGKEALRPGVL